MNWWKNVTEPVRLWWQVATDRATGKAPAGARRSAQWPHVRDVHLITHNRCACCGGTAKLRVHHIEPFHACPDKELDPNNLITLCEAKRYGVNCHLLIGHLGNWRKFNPLARMDAARWKLKLSGRCQLVAKRVHEMLIRESVETSQ